MIRHRTDNTLFQSIMSDRDYDPVKSHNVITKKGKIIAFKLAYPNYKGKSMLMLSCHEQLFNEYVLSTTSPAIFLTTLTHVLSLTSQLCDKEKEYYNLTVFTDISQCDHSLRARDCAMKTFRVVSNLEKTLDQKHYELSDRRLLSEGISNCNILGGILWTESDEKRCKCWPKLLDKCEFPIKFQPVHVPKKGKPVIETVTL